jgi:tetratricopeptide (TPR) repeat protein
MPPPGARWAGDSMRVGWRSFFLLCCFVPGLSWASPTRKNAEDLLKRFDFPGAIRILQELVSTTRDPAANEENRRALFLAALDAAHFFRSAEESKLYREIALDAISPLLNANSVDGKTWFLVATAQQDLGRTTAAENSLVRSVHLGYFDGARRLAETLLQQGEYDSAQSLLLLAVNARPADATLWYLLGLVQQQCGDLEGAVSSLERAVALRFRDTDALLLLGEVLVALERYDEGIAIYERALAADSSRWVIPFTLAGVYTKLEKPREAAWYYEAAITLAERDITTRHNQQADLALILNNYAWYLCTGKNPALHSENVYQKAYAMAERAVSLTKRERASHLDTLAEAAYRLGKKQEAADLAREVLALGGLRSYYQEQVERFERAQEQPVQRGERVNVLPER